MTCGRKSRSLFYLPSLLSNLFGIYIYYVQLRTVAAVVLFEEFVRG